MDAGLFSVAVSAHPSRLPAPRCRSSGQCPRPVPQGRLYVARHEVPGRQHARTESPAGTIDSSRRALARHLCVSLPFRVIVRLPRLVRLGRARVLRLPHSSHETKNQRQSHLFKRGVEYRRGRRDLYVLHRTGHRNAVGVQLVPSPSPGARPPCQPP